MEGFGEELFRKNIFHHDYPFRDIRLGYGKAGDIPLGVQLRPHPVRTVKGFERRLFGLFVVGIGDFR
jgi:hypothetical protein